MVVVPLVTAPKHNLDVEPSHLSRLILRESHFAVRGLDRLFGYFIMHREEFLKSYHKLSTAESTYSALKRVFGDSVRSKTRIAQINGVLLKVLAHNIRCSIHAMAEMGISSSLR